MRIGIDLGGTSVSAGLVDENCNIVCRVSLRTAGCRSENELLSVIYACVRELISKSGVDMGGVFSIGLGSPGESDYKNGFILGASNLPLHNTPIAKYLSAEFGKEVLLDNDANCAAWGEFIAGGAKGLKNAVMVTLGTGIGGGIIIDGKIVHGITNHAGEIGHFVIDYNGGKLCGCGRTGCWETLASTKALTGQVKAAAEKSPDSLLAAVIAEDGGVCDGKTLFKALKRNCPLAEKLFERYIFLLSVGILNIRMAYQPEIIILGGGISREGKIITDPLEKLTRGWDVRLKTSVLGDGGGMIGAAMLHRERNG